MEKAIIKKQYKGIICYDGEFFHGWQYQPDKKTVQGELQKNLSLIMRKEIHVQGASRTDAGVHALGQTFTFYYEGNIPTRLRHAVSQLLAPHAKVMEIEEVPLEFDVCRDVKWKKYCYTFELSKEPSPFTIKYAWHVPYKIDLVLLRELLPELIGTHDFAGFQSTGSQMQTTVRTLYSVELKEGGVITSINSANLWHIEFVGNGFLYHMIRNITGTLIEIARGRFPKEFLYQCLNTNKKFNGLCAPPHGLTLVEIKY